MSIAETIQTVKAHIEDLQAEVESEKKWLAQLKESEKISNRIIKEFVKSIAAK